MSTTHRRLIALVAIAFASAPLPASAQEARRREGGGRREGGRAEQQGEARREARGPAGAEQAGREDARRDVGRDVRQAVRRWPGQADGPRGDNRDERRALSRAQAQPRWDGGRNDSRGPDRARGRDDGRDGWRGDRRDAPRVVVPRRDARPRVVVPQYRNYGYRASPRRSYVLPYGYRPYGYRPGWSVNLYFGRPYGAYAYDRPVYGYYGLTPGFAYGSLRIVDAPRDAHVFVDGYYAGIVDDYDGVFQRLNLEPGPHTIEIEIDPDDPPVQFDVRIVPGDTVTIHVPRYW